MATEAMNSRLDRIENRVDANVSDTAELKGAYEHLATKADVERVEKRLQRFILAVATAVIVILTYLQNVKLDEILERLP
ncbi:MAG: hypothetical protein F4X02_06980 [Chloroflexi bacterium]|nr:hypothetical protein [Chloroflexota bacterium]